MNLDSLSFTLSQISYLVANLSKKNYKQSTQELANLVQIHGLEADRHLLRCLFSNVDFSVEGNRNSSGGSKDSLQTQLLILECNNLLSKPALISLLCYAFDHPLHQQKTLKPAAHLFPQLRKLLKLTPVQEVVFGLALEHSSNPELQKLASQFVRLKLPELVNSYVDAESSRQHEGGLHDTTPEVLHLILTSLTQESAPALWKRVQRDFPREHVPVVLSPLLYPTTTDPPPAHMDQSDTAHCASLLDAGLASLVPDVGSSFTSSLETCKTMVNNLTGGELSPANVAHTITAMLLAPPADAAHANYFDKLDKSASSNDSQWNIEIFITAVKELHPNMAWRDVVAELDNAKFLIKDRHAFLQLVTSLRLCFDKFSFPIDLFYRRWNNADGQYSLILQILKNPETFSFADYPFHAVPVDSLKASPDSDNKEVATWRSQDLIEILLALGEHHRLYTQIIELFKFPIQHCPDVLMLGLLQNSAPLSGLRQELVTLLIPTFLGIHPNSGVILHYAWNNSSHVINVRSIMMACMAEWYLRSESDQGRLSRILDIAQDLKALTLILASQVLPFVIDLACLASRRGYLKLDKWLSDKIREHGESFISACVTFLQRRCPQIAGQGKEDVPPKGAQLPHETLTTVLSCLQACAASVSKELSDAILAMIANCTLLANKARQPTAGVLRHRGLEPFAFPSAAQQLDPLSGLTTALQGMGIVPSMTNMSGGLGSLVPTPASPSRMLPNSQSPFPVFINQSLQHPAGASQVVPGVGVPRVPAPGIEKLNVGATMFGEHMKPIPKEVEDEANSYFQRIYNHPPHPTLSIEEVLEMLKKFMESSKPRERDVFNCMIKNLFEEYQFFPQYPEKELFVTAQLFGGIIEQGLMNNYMALGLALRFVLDALRKPHGSKMYYFGITALDRFKTKLRDWAKYCEHVASIPHFREFPPHLIAYVDFGLQSTEPQTALDGPVLPPHLASLLQQPQKVAGGVKTVNPVAAPSLAGAKTPALSGRPSIANATNIDTLLMATEKEEKMTIPPETFQDKISFIFNNLSQLNLPTKSEELREMIKKEYFPWIAQYLVLKRVTIELNFHVLYSSVLDILKHPDLNRLVLRETYRNIRVLLRSDKGIANFSDRSLLKNLGHWLGMQTLAKNKPILMVDIDLKSLIMEAYTKGQQELLYVIPFVAKVMESCAKSKVFRPKNPWTMAVMNLLAELHREPDLKLNLKFEIEVLCKALDTEVSKLTPTLLLKDPKRLEAIEKQLSKLDDEITAAPHAAQHIPVAAPPPPPPAPKSIQPSTEEMQHIPTSNSIIFNSTTNANAMTPLPVAPGTPNPTNTPVVPAPVEPRFHVMDLNVASFSNLPQHMISIPQLAIFRDYPQLKTQVRSAIEQAVQEWDQPVTERSIKIAATTTEYVVRRDFAVDCDETRLRMAAHTLVRCLTGSMAMMTCRDHMQASICTNLKTAFTTHLRGASKLQLDQAEAAAAAIAEANMDVACAFIQKAAIEKAIPEIDKRLNEDYELRKIARSEGRRYCDTSMLTYQAERMPEAIRHPVGGASNARVQSVYGECGKTVPGFHPLTDHEAKLLGQKDALPSNVCFPEEEILSVYDKLIVDLEIYLQSALSSGSTNPRVILLHALREAALIARRMRDHTSALPLLQKAVEGLFESLLAREDHEGWVRNRDAYLRVLKTFHEARIDPQWTVKNVTRCLLEAREEIRYNLDIFDCLVRSGLIYLPQFDEYLGQVIEASLNYTPIMFAMQLIQVYLIDERVSPVLFETDVPNTISALVRLHALRRDAPPGLSGLLDVLRAVNDPTTLADQQQPAAAVANSAFNNIHAGILLARNRDFEDSLPERCEFLLREWISTYSPTVRDQPKSFTHIIQQMNYAGIFKSEEMIAKFIRISAEICVLNCSRAVSDNAGRIKCYYTLDAFVRLTYLIIKHLGDVSAPIRLCLMNKTLGIITGLLLMDHDNRTNEFNQMPYERLYIMLFLELTQPEPYLESINYQILTSFCHVFHLVRPAKAPKFAFAWLELIAHRAFITRVMALTPQQKGWPLYSQLLTALFKFLAPFLRNTDLPKAVGLLYRGTLRVLLVLLHDFPEFLCDYHYGFCDVIPSNCIQMRNLILSAFPRNMRLPDPFTPNLKVEILTEIAAAPRVVSNVASMITPATFRKDLDSYLKLRAPVTFLSELRSSLQVSNEPGMSYNTQLMNALVLYVGTQAIQYIRSKGLAPNMSTIASSAHMDIFQNLGVDLDTEGRYLFLNAIANQLRYPNSHTHYFSCLLLSLFAESNTESIQEQITRVLLERLIVNRPHPWGLLITFIELIKNPIYKFWSHEFVHCAPEIEKLFESVARSCMVSKQVNQNDNDTGEALAV